MRFDAMGGGTALLALVIGGMMGTSAQAATFSYADFADTTGLQINGAAVATDVDGRTVMQLTPAEAGKGGSMFNTQAIALDNGYSFSTLFTFNINSNHQTQWGEIGADGIAFVIQTMSNTVGGLGGGLGYEGISPSVEIEFDQYSNYGVDPRLPGNDTLNGNDHIAIMMNGSPRDPLAYKIVSPTLELDSGRDITAFVDYNGATSRMEVRWSTDGQRPDGVGLSYLIDLASLFGTNPVYVGFTASTGADWSAQDIVNWTFNDTYDPITAIPNETVPIGSSGTSAVPEPATWAMMIAGFGLVGAALRRRRRLTA